MNLHWVKTQHQTYLEHALTLTTLIYFLHTVLKPVLDTSLRREHDTNWFVWASLEANELATSVPNITAVSQVPHIFYRYYYFLHACIEKICGILTASTACWRIDVNLENILFFDWINFSREDLENSSIFFLLLPLRSRLLTSYSDLQRKISDIYFTCLDTLSRFIYTFSDDKLAIPIPNAVRPPWHFQGQSQFLASTRGRTRGRLCIAY